MICRWLAASLFVSFFFLPGISPAQQPKAPRKDRHALLVGVTVYETLPAAKHLAGPGNDVLLVHKMLIERFQFSPDQITVLSEEKGKKPTRANIERAFKDLADIAQPGDQVMIHMGGHGSQQPEDKNSPDPEPDGLDEIFLPRDLGRWNPDTKKVANAIIDDEIGAWLKAIRDKKASVWIVFDSCHSGTMIRGGAKEVTRDLDPVVDLGISKKEIKDAVDFAKKRPATSRSLDGKAPAFKLAQEGGIVAIYACQPSEVTFERELPARGKDAKVHGLLTYAMCKILTEATEKSRKPITYNELAQRIYGQYIQWGRYSPTPQIEGVDRHREVLGDAVWPGRSSIFLLKGKDGVYEINAGALNGLTPGSILAVTPPPGQGNFLAGHVRIKELFAHSAKVDACVFGKVPLTKNLPVRGACSPVFIDVGDQQLGVAVDPLDASDKTVPEPTRANLEKLVKGLVGPESLVRHVDKTSRADWLLRVQGKDVVLVPASGWAVGRPPVGAARFGPAPMDDRLGAWLENGLTRIARAENLKRLTAGGASSNGEKGVRLEVKLKRKKDAADKVGSIPIDWPAPDVVVYDGDRFVINLTNQGDTDIDVTLLYIDSGFGISCLYPHPRMFESNRLGGKESHAVNVMFKSKTTGVEQIVVIAVKGKKGQQTTDFSLLEQPTLEQALKSVSVKRGAELKVSLETPLGNLLKKGMYAEGRTRGTSVVEMNDYSVSAISFNVRPQRRPEAGPQK